MKKCTLQIETEYYTDKNNVYIILPDFKDGDEVRIKSCSLREISTNKMTSAKKKEG